MLREFKWVSQVRGEPLRRWFSDLDFDLIIWQDDDSIVGFQLCYAKARDEQALSWQSPSSYCHSRVDAGDCRPGRHKAAPILLPGGSFDAMRVARDFLINSAAIEPAVSSFVYDKLLEYGIAEARRPTEGRRPRPAGHSDADASAAGRSRPGAAANKDDRGG